MYNLQYWPQLHVQNMVLLHKYNPKDSKIRTLATNTLDARWSPQKHLWEAPKSPLAQRGNEFSGYSNLLCNIYKIDCLRLSF